MRASVSSVIISSLDASSRSSSSFCKADRQAARAREKGASARGLCASRLGRKRRAFLPSSSALTSCSRLFRRPKLLMLSWSSRVTSGVPPPCANATARAHGMRRPLGHFNALTCVHECDGCRCGRARHGRVEGCGVTRAVACKGSAETRLRHGAARAPNAGSSCAAVLRRSDTRGAAKAGGETPVRGSGAARAQDGRRRRVSQQRLRKMRTPNPPPPPRPALPPLPVPRSRSHTRPTVGRCAAAAQWSAAWPPRAPAAARHKPCHAAPRRHPRLAAARAPRRRHHAAPRRTAADLRPAARSATTPTPPPAAAATPAATPHHRPRTPRRSIGGRSSRATWTSAPRALRTAPPLTSWAPWTLRKPRHRRKRLRSLRQKSTSEREACA